MTDCFFCGEDLQDPPPARINAFEYDNSKIKTAASRSRWFFFRLVCVSLSAQPAESNRSVGPPTVGGCQLKRRRYVSEQEWEGSLGGEGRIEVKAVRDAHLIQKSYAVSALDGGKCVTHFISRAF